MDTQDLIENEIVLETEPLPDAFFGGREELNENDDDVGSLIDRLVPDDLPFFKMAMLDKLRNRPYHIVSIEGPFDKKSLVRDYRAQLYRSEGTLYEKGKCGITRFLLCLGEGVFVYLNRSDIDVYAPTPRAASNAAHSFLRYVKPAQADKAGFFVVSLEGTEPSTDFVPVERTAPVSDDELTLHYGADFIAWEKDWINCLSKRSSGVTILHGPPGCGKTSYLRALLARMIDQFVFYYLPITEAAILSSQSFIGFWMRESRRFDGKHKIVFLEDAEDLLLPRDEGSRARVSNLLQIGDGFLGDHLKLHVIATTNEPITRLDSAMMRPGRLMGIREFRRLNPIEASRLAKAKGIQLSQQSDYSLAEIYVGPQQEIDKEHKIVGFAQKY